MKAWWDQLAEREQWLVGSGAVLGVILLLYALVWEPLSTANRQLRKAVAQQRAELLWMQKAAQEVKRLSGLGTNTEAGNDGRSLLTVVDETAKAMGVGSAMKQVVPQGEDKLNAQLDGVIFDQLIPWMGALEQQHRIALVNLRIDRTPSPGRVNARLLLQSQSP